MDEHSPTGTASSAPEDTSGVAEGPLAAWDDDRSEHRLLVWWSRLDGRYLVEVDRIDGTADRALLRVFDHADTERELLREPVRLAYGARFGPDLEDLAAWQSRAVTFVDDELPDIRRVDGQDSHGEPR